jgi:hypothetical protein
VWSSSTEAFGVMQLLGYKLYLTPFASGVVLYGSYILALTALFFALLWKRVLRVHSFFHDEAQLSFVLAALLLYLAQSNLGFNVLLTAPTRDTSTTAFHS